MGGPAVRRRRQPAHGVVAVGNRRGYDGQRPCSYFSVNRLFALAHTLMFPRCSRNDDS
jgi:hypothetical protein